MVNTNKVFEVFLYRGQGKGTAGRIATFIVAESTRECASKAIRVARIVNLKNTGFGQVSRISIRYGATLTTFPLWKVSKSLLVSVGV